MSSTSSPSDVKTAGKADKAPSTGRRRAGVIGAVVGVAAAGVAAGIAVERLVVRRTQKTETDPYANEPFGRLPYDEFTTVTTADGTELHVEIVEPVDGVAVELHPTDPTAPTLVFVHGFCLDQGTFHFQRQALDRLGEHRMVFYDQPGHGLSGTMPDGEYELPALGEALYDVIKSTVPTGPIVLVGHSMGGMAIMAFAEQHPEMFVDRVVGTVLIATSGGQIDGQGGFYGLPAIINRTSGPLLGLLTGAARITGPMIDKARQASTDLAWLLTRRYGFGGDKPSPALVSYVEQMNSRTTTETVARYLRTINSHARYPALRALNRVPVLVICGDCDMITPQAHSEEICRLLPHAKLVIIPDSGHVTMLEHAPEVNAALIDFLDELEQK
ncbi:alpha/beta hydrolase [Catellatospora sp. KI3]|uniref:alpha/beta fold hydrolase n=1 Tax=Catellatospora sp. KI3 TaxID=3041620 RepID=UPI0024822CF5|nr:alpha/beta hydrolase [Catellatospora sp. KI3]MDI1460304.1 alpha/beta hydrolase [Catellatospora sp. KI3]